MIKREKEKRKKENRGKIMVVSQEIRCITMYKDVCMCEYLDRQAHAQLMHKGICN